MPCCSSRHGPRRPVASARVLGEEVLAAAAAVRVEVWRTRKRRGSLGGGDARPGAIMAAGTGESRGTRRRRQQPGRRERWRNRAKTVGGLARAGRPPRRSATPGRGRAGRPARWSPMAGRGWPARRSAVAGEAERRVRVRTGKAAGAAELQLCGRRRHSKPDLCSRRGKLELYASTDASTATSSMLPKHNRCHMTMSFGFELHLRYWCLAPGGESITRRLLQMGTKGAQHGIIIEDPHPFVLDADGLLAILLHEDLLLRYRLPICVDGFDIWAFGCCSSIAREENILKIRREEFMCHQQLLVSGCMKLSLPRPLVQGPARALESKLNVWK